MTTLSTSQTKVAEQRFSPQCVVDTGTSVSASSRRVPTFLTPPNFALTCGLYGVDGLPLAVIYASGARAFRGRPDHLSIIPPAHRLPLPHHRVQVVERSGCHARSRLVVQFILKTGEVPSSNLKTSQRRAGTAAPPETCRALSAKRRALKVSRPGDNVHRFIHPLAISSR